MCKVIIEPKKKLWKTIFKAMKRRTRNKDAKGWSQIGVKIKRE